MNFKQTTLPNGLQVITGEIPGTELENLATWFRQGNRDEKKDEDNYYHLLEHIMLAGSENYPSEFEIAKTTTDTGSYLNASTWLEHVSIETEFLISHLDKIFDLTADLALKPLISKEFVDREAKIVNEELKRTTADIQKTMNYYANISMYNNTALANIPYGQNRNIKNATPEKLKVVYDRMLNPAEMAIIAIGGVPHEKIIALADKYYRPLTVKPIIARETAEPRPKLFEPDWQSKETKNVRFCLPAISYANPDIFPFLLINSFLFHGQDSLLYQELRIKRGLVYTVWADNSSFSDAGYWFIDFASSQPDEVINIIKKTLSNLVLTDENLEQAKNRLLFRRQRLFNANHQFAIKTLGQAFEKLAMVELPEEFEQKIRQVTLSDIQKVISVYLDPSRAIIVKTK